MLQVIIEPRPDACHQLRNGCLPVLGSNIHPEDFVESATHLTIRAEGAGEGGLADAPQSLHGGDFLLAGDAHHALRAIGVIRHREFVLERVEVDGAVNVAIRDAFGVVGDCQRRWGFGNARVDLAQQIRFFQIAFLV